MSTELVRSALESQRRVLDRWTRYLAAYKVIEGNLALFDKLARCRDFKEFEDAIYEAVRLKDKIKRRLEEDVANNRIIIYGELTPNDFLVDDRDIADLMSLATGDLHAPRIIGSLIASFALAYGGLIEVEKGQKG